MTINLDGVLERGKTLDDFAREPESLVANVIKDAPFNEAIQQIRGQLHSGSYLGIDGALIREARHGFSADFFELQNHTNAMLMRLAELTFGPDYKVKLIRKGFEIEGTKALFKRIEIDISDRKNELLVKADEDWVCEPNDIYLGIDFLVTRSSFSYRPANGNPSTVLKIDQNFKGPVRIQEKLLRYMAKSLSASETELRRICGDLKLDFDRIKDFAPIRQLYMPAGSPLLVDHVGVKDLSRFRAITNSVEDCYSFLTMMNGYLVGLSMEDYIADPRKNGYQSIHGLVSVPQQRFVEYQIRDKTMHEIAESAPGVAHDKYEEIQKDYLKIMRVILGSKCYDRLVTDLSSIIPAKHYFIKI